MSTFIDISTERVNEPLYSPKYGGQKTEKLCTTDEEIQAK